MKVNKLIKYLPTVNRQGEILKQKIKDTLNLILMLKTAKAIY